MSSLAMWIVAALGVCIALLCIIACEIAHDIMRSPDSIERWKAEMERRAREWRDD